MSRFVPAVALSLFAAPALADTVCEDLWFARNMMFAEAGYCFASPLGQAIFGTAGCSGTDVALDAEAKAFVDEVRDRELGYGCQVDTTRSGISVPHLTRRMALSDQPIRGEGESACIGWKSEPLAILSGWRPGARTLGQFSPGDYIYFAHEDKDDWSFVQVFRDDVLVVMGWVQFGPHDPDACDGWAG